MPPDRPGPSASVPHTRMNPRSRYIAHSSSLTHERSSARARASARRSRPGSYDQRRGALPARLVPAPQLVDPRNDQVGQQRKSDKRGRCERQHHGAAGPTCRLLPAGRRSRGRRPRESSSNERTMIDSRRPCRPETGTAAHSPASSWRRNSSIRRCSSSARSTSPSAIRTSPWPGFILKKRTRGLCQNRVGSRPLLTGAKTAQTSGLQAIPRTSTGPGPAPISRSPCATARDASARAARAASSGSSPWARRAASTEECVQPEPCAAPSWWRSPGSSTSRSAVEEHVGRGVAVAAGDDDDLRVRARGPPRARLARSSRSPAPLPRRRPGRASSVRASGTFGVRTVALGSSSSIERGPRLGVEQHRPGLRHHHRIEHDRRAARQLVERAAPPPRSSAGRPSIPILTASTPMSSATARTWARMISGGIGMDGGDADRVLGGDRGDRGHAVDAAGGERLQVGLDAGAAAGVRPGDRQDPREHDHERTPTRCDRQDPRISRETSVASGVTRKRPPAPRLTNPSSSSAARAARPCRAQTRPVPARRWSRGRRRSQSSRG